MEENKDIKEAKEELDRISQDDLLRRRVLNRTLEIADKLQMKKPHPCGTNVFEVLRIGADFKIRCTGCGREVMVPRHKCEKNIRKIVRESAGSEQ